TTQIKYVDRPSGYTREIDVLGNRVTVNLRADGHQTLMRLNDLYMALAPGVDHQIMIRVYFLPPLNSHPFHLALLLRRSPDGILKDRIRSYMDDEYMRLGKLETSTEDLRRLMGNEAAAVQEDTVVDEAVTLLIEWGL